MPLKKKPEEGETIYEEFSKEEKDAIIRRHKELVERFNKTLPDNLKVAVDPDLEEKLDDPQTIAIYRIAKEMEAKREKQKAIEAKLEAKYGKCNANPNPLSRAFFYELDPSGTPAAEEYNEKLYKDYIKDPNKVVFLRYGKALETDPTAIYNCNDDKLKLVEYYRDTYPLCEEGFVFSSVVGRPESATPEMYKALRSIVKPMETIGYPVNLVRAACGLDYFACPSLTLEQSAMIQSLDLELMRECGEPLKRTLDEVIVGQTVDSPKTFFGKFVERGIKLEQGMFAKLRPEQYDLDADGKPINIKEAKYDEVFNAAPDANFRIGKREGNDLFKVSSINKSFEAEYMKAWKKAFLRRREEIAEDIDIARLEDQHKGGWWERFRGTTSVQYKEFLQAFKDYHDPQSPNYLNKENLKTKGNAYLERKRGQGYSDISRMKGTSKIRAQWVTDTIAACDEVKIDDVAKDWLKDYAPEIKREPFLKAQDVEENPLENENAAAKDKQMDLESEVEIEDKNAISA